MGRCNLNDELHFMEQEHTLEFRSYTGESRMYTKATSTFHVSSTNPPISKLMECHVSGGDVIFARRSPLELLSALLVFAAPCSRPLKRPRGGRGSGYTEREGGGGWERGVTPEAEYSSSSSSSRMSFFVHPRRSIRKFINQGEQASPQFNSLCTWDNFPPWNPSKYSHCWH